MVHLANHHSHTTFSDGKASPELYVLNAIEESMVTIGFSDHAPIPHPGLVGMRMEDLPEYIRIIDALRNRKEDQIQIYKSLEVDYIPDIININSPHIVGSKLDYTIGAVHYVDQFEDGSFWSFESGHEDFQRGICQIFDGDVRAAISRYYSLIREMVCDHTPDIVAHLDRIKKLNAGNRYFNEKEKWYQDEVIATLEAIARNGCIMEVNTKGFYSGDSDDSYPSRWILQIANHLGIATHLASDAHHPNNLRSGFGFGLKQLQAIGYQKTMVMIDHSWQDSSLINSKIYIY